MDDILDDPTLDDPDGESESKYGWDEEFQRHIIALIVSDRQFLLQSLDLIRPNYFTNKAHAKICDLVFNYFKKYRLMPKKAFVIQELRSQFAESKSLPAYLAELNIVYDYFEPGLDHRDYLSSKIQYFAKMQAFRKAFHEGLKLLDDNPESEENWNKIYDGIEKVITTTTNFDLGHNYFEKLQERYNKVEEEEEQKERFITGLDGIDDKISGKGYSKGEIISFVAGSGVGKSVMLACITAKNLLKGKKGVYVTLELAEDKVAERLDAILSGLPIQNLYGHKDEVLEKLSSLQGVDYDDKMPLVIKQFPSGTASVNTLRAFISQLRFHGYNPDFMIVDYVGEMADIPGLKTYESREKIVRDLRAMALEDDLFIATAMQPNRDSKDERKNEKGKIDDTHLADSFGQIRPLDGCFSLNQNDTEKKCGIGRCYVIKQRDGLSRYMIYLRFNKDNLTITEISQAVYKSIYSSHKETVSDDIQIDKVVAPFESLPPED